MDKIEGTIIIIGITIIGYYNYYLFHIIQTFLSLLILCRLRVTNIELKKKLKGNGGTKSKRAKTELWKHVDIFYRKMTKELF